ncbi:MAG: helix-turn-helix transcriptional regulator [Nevskia sp.]|nr:helix-turn-helix transcriptional regulator [Nevskia sp.]
MIDRRARIAGRRLAAARQAAGLTQAQLAEQAGVSYQEISHEGVMTVPPDDRWVADIKQDWDVWGRRGAARL